VKRLKEIEERILESEVWSEKDSYLYNALMHEAESRSIFIYIEPILIDFLSVSADHIPESASKNVLLSLPGLVHPHVFFKRGH
jgi:hypothetical protein